MSYNFTITLRPWGEDHGTVQIDPVARYGYWEYRDGSEGGGLWFDQNEDGGPWKLELVDYDGAFCFPRAVFLALRDAGFAMEETFDPDYQSE